MGKKIKNTVVIDFESNVESLEKAFNKINNLSTGLDISKGSKENVKKLVGRIQQEILNIKSKTQNGSVELIDAKDIEKSTKTIQDLFSKLQVISQSFSKSSGFDKMNKDIRDYGKNLDEINRKLETARNIQKRKQNKKDSFKSVISDEEYSKKIETQESKEKTLKEKQSFVKENKSKYNELKKLSKSQELKTEDKGFVKQYEEATKEVSSLKNELEELETTLKNTTSKSNADKISKELEEANLDVKNLEASLNKIENSNPFNRLIEQLKQAGISVDGLKSLDDVEQKLKQLTPEEIERLSGELVDFNTEINKSKNTVDKLGDKVNNEFKGMVEDTEKANKSFAEMTQKLQYFFGMSNSIQLFKRALRESFQSVKELDSAMKEIAVVSEYDISDMWKSLPQFTKQANALGVAITDVYDATGLYVQQGLDLVESQGLANETLKMAKIAGMDAAAATDAMTSALRGFNMELNQGSAEKVNDIYSKLAAITASDTQEIATAMSKTASIANNAGASIENTAAFLSQIIETTRESAETAGTALKTVIARFSELKKNPAEIGNVDGEIVDANAIEGALRLANVDLRGADGQFRNFDEVIIELSGQWDKLDKNTQRYIATIAAGSRQQSRFLALMSNNERLLQLTDAAYNSAGASQQQFNKTLDSMESKLNQLKNAWDTFTRNLMNSELIKLGVDLLTGILTAINNITSVFQKLGPVMGTVLSTSMVAAFFVMAKKGVDSLTGFIGTKMQQTLSKFKGTAKTEGENSGTQYGLSITESAERIIKPWLQKTKGMLQSVIPGKKKVPVTTPNTTSLSDKDKYNQLWDNARNNNHLNKNGGIDKRYLSKDDKNFAKNYELEHQDELNKKLDQTKAKVDKTHKSIQGLGSAFMVAGMACGFFAQQLKENGNEKGAEVFEKLGAGVSFVGSALIIVIPLFDRLKESLKKNGKEVSNIGGKLTLWIAIAVAAITIIKEIVTLISNNSLAGKITAARKATEKTTAAAQKAQEAYSNWLGDKNEYSGIIDAMNELSEGTAAWSEQMDKLQDKVYEMINTYPELAQYVQQDGTISEEGLRYYDEKLKKEKQIANAISVGTKMKQNELEYQKDIKDLNKEKKKEQKEINKIDDETLRAERQKAHDSYYKMREKELNDNFNKAYEGNLNYLMQNANIEGKYADNISAVMANQTSGHDYGQKVQNKVDADTIEYDVASASFAANTAVAGAAAGVMLAAAGGMMTIPVAGWVAAGITAAAAGIVAGVSYAVKRKERKELQEAYAEMIGKPLEEIDESILEDTDFLASAVSVMEENEAFEKEAKKIEFQINALGSRAGELFEENLSLLDKDFGDEGFNGWIEYLKASSEGLDDYIDDAVKKFEEKKKAVQDSLTSIFGGSVNFKSEAEQGQFTLSGENAQALYDAQQNLTQIFGSDSVNALNAVIQKYDNTQMSVHELVDAYTELGSAATLAQKALAAKKMVETGNRALADLGMTFATVNAEALSATNLFKDFYMTLSSDQLNELFKNGKTTAQSVYELRDSLSDIPAMAEVTGVSFATLSDTLNDLQSGIIQVDDLTVGYLETLEKLNKASHIIEDSLAKAMSFKDPTSATNIASKGSGVAENLLKIFNEQRFGDETAIQTYFDYMFGEGAWDKALKQANYDAQAAMSKWIPTLQNLVNEGNFESVWVDAIGKSKGRWKISENGQGIEFNLKGVKNTTELIKEIESLTGWTEEFIKQALSDAEVWSNDLKSTLSMLDAQSGLSDWISELEIINNKVHLNTDQLESFFNTLPKGLFDSLEMFQDWLKELLTNKGLELGVADTEAENAYAKFLAASKENEGYKTFSYNNTKEQKADLADAAGHKYYDSQKGISKQYLEKYLRSLGFSEYEVISELDKYFSDENFNNLVSRNKAYENTTAGTRYVKLGALEDFKYGRGVKNEGQLKTDMVSFLQDEFKRAFEKTGNVSSAREAVLQKYSAEDLYNIYGVQPEELSNVDIASQISDLFDADGWSQWITEQPTVEQKNLAEQARLINEGMLKAVDYYYRLSGNGDPDLQVKKLEINLDNYVVEGLKITDANNALTETTTNTTSAIKKVGDVSNEVSEYMGGFANETEAITAYLGMTEEALKKSLEDINFDWMYNLNSYMERATRNLQKLETEYELLLKKRNTNPQELTENLVEQFANLDVQRQVADATVENARKRLDAFKTNNSSLSKFVQEDGNGMVTIDWNKLYEANESGDIDNLEKAETLLKELETDANAINENQQESLDVQLQQAEFLENVNNTIIDFENQVKDMVISEYEKEIDKLSQIDSSINDANSKLITSIQNSVNRMRQDRENEKTESDIESKQRRLALLRADSSGANRQEILSLEKEIAEAQQGYTDNLVDQKISELQKQNEDASAQRQEQISIAQAQLDSLKENGGINDSVQKILAASTEFKGSPLEDLWKEINKSAGFSDTEWAKNINAFEDEFNTYAGSKSFKENYTEDNGINEQMKQKIAEIMPDLDAFGKTISLAFSTEATKILSQSEKDKSYSDQKIEAQKKANSNKTNEAAAVDLNGYFANSTAGQLKAKGGNVSRDYFDSFAQEMKDVYGYTDRQINYFYENMGVTDEGYKTTGYGLDAGEYITFCIPGEDKENRVYNNIYGSLGIPQSWIDNGGGRVAISETTAKRIGLWDQNWKGAFEVAKNRGYGWIEIPSKHFKKYATGGLNTFTGPAWLDGTPSKPELVLNAKDTQNFLQLKDILSSLMNGAHIPTNQNNGELNLEIYLNVEQGISSDYDVEQLVTKVKQEIAKVGRERNIQILTKR